MNPLRTMIGLTLAVACLCAVSTLRLGAQGQNGPQTPPKAPPVIRVPTNPTPDKPPIPTEEMIRRFAAHEDEFLNARSGYTYRRTVRLDELGPDGKPTGSSEITTEYEMTPDGTLRAKATKKPESTLRFAELEPDALDVLAKIPPFPLVTVQLPKYDIVYQTMEPVDELMTYVFRVTPKQLDRDRALFSGLVWVDDHDFAIVKSYGKWVSELGDVSPPQLPFTMFETYRQPVANRYWLPAYSRSDGAIAGKQGSAQVRLIIRWDDYKSGLPDRVSQSPASSQPPAPPR